MGGNILIYQQDLGTVAWIYALILRGDQPVILPL